MASDWSSACLHLALQPLISCMTRIHRPVAFTPDTAHTLKLDLHRLAISCAYCWHSHNAFTNTRGLTTVATRLRGEMRSEARLLGSDSQSRTTRLGIPFARLHRLESTGRAWKHWTHWKANADIPHTPLAAITCAVAVYHTPLSSILHVAWPSAENILPSSLQT
jgi:hypothetical protein